MYTNNYIILNDKELKKMSDKAKRIQLEDGEVEKIAGGMLVVLSTRKGVRKCWSEFNPDVCYTFDDVQAIYDFQIGNPQYSNDDEALIAALLGAGILRPL